MMVAVNILCVLIVAWIVGSVIRVAHFRRYLNRFVECAFLFARCTDKLMTVVENKHRLSFMCCIPFYGIRVTKHVVGGLSYELIQNSGLDNAVHAYFKLGIRSLRDILDYLSDIGNYTESVMLGGFYAMYYESVTYTAMCTAECLIENGPINLNDFNKGEQMCIMRLLKTAAERERREGNEEVAVRMEQFAYVDDTNMMGTVSASTMPVQVGGDTASDPNYDPEYNKKVNEYINELRNKGITDPLDLIDGVYDKGYHDAVGYMLYDYINRHTNKEQPAQGEDGDEDGDDGGFRPGAEDPFEGKFVYVSMKLIRDHHDTDKYVKLAEFILPYMIKEEAYKSCALLNNYIKEYNH